MGCGGQRHSRGRAAGRPCCAGTTLPPSSSGLSLQPYANPWGVDGVLCNAKSLPLRKSAICVARLLGRTDGMPLGPKLRSAREKAGLSQADACARSGVGESSLSEFENGRRAPSLAQLDALARTYSRSLASLLSDEPEPATVVLWRQRPPAGAEDVEAKFLGCPSSTRIWNGGAVRRRAPVAVTPRNPQHGFERRRGDGSFRPRPAGAWRPAGSRPSARARRGLRSEIFHLPFEPTERRPAHEARPSVTRSS